MSQFNRNDLISLANICHKNGLYHDAISYMKEVTKLGTPLNFEERDVLFRSCDKMIKPYVYSHDSSGKSGVDEKLQREINQKAKSKVYGLCDEVIQLLDSECVKSDTNIEAFAHYKCFRACLHKWKGLVASGADRQLELNKSLTGLEEAYKIGKNLKPAHPVAILTALDFSALHFDLTDTVDENLAIATEAYNEGSSHLSEVSGELKSYSIKFLEELQDNIQEWS